jgi:hypothetical protein
MARHMKVIQRCYHQHYRCYYYSDIYNLLRFSFNRCVQEILGVMLYTDPVDPKLEALPSPEDLKYKVWVGLQPIGSTVL